MVSKEDFNKVWKDSSRENILNQFYYEHNELFRIKKEVSEYIKNNKLYNEEYYTHNGDKYIKSVDDFLSRQYLLYLLDKGE